MVTYREISEKDWETLPVPTPPKPVSPWDEVLGKLESGKIVQLDVPQDKVKSTRISLARTAATRGFRLEFRVLGDTMSVKRSEVPLSPKKK